MILSRHHGLLIRLAANGEESETNSPPEMMVVPLPQPSPEDVLIQIRAKKLKLGFLVRFAS